MTIARQLAGSPQGGEFTRRSNSRPPETLSGDRIALVRATAGQVRVIYNQDGEHVRITALLRDTEKSALHGSEVWVEEGSVLTATPAAGNRDRMSSVAANQVSRLAREIADGGDPREAIDALLASMADRRDPFIMRGTRRRHGEELEEAPWPDLDIVD
jgi:hypothetical protein